MSLVATSRPAIDHRQPNDPRDQPAATPRHSIEAHTPWALAFSLERLPATFGRGPGREGGGQLLEPVGRTTPPDADRFPLQFPANSGAIRSTPLRQPGLTERGVIYTLMINFSIWYWWPNRFRLPALPVLIGGLLLPLSDLHLFSTRLAPGPDRNVPVFDLYAANWILYIGGQVLFAFLPACEDDARSSESPWSATRPAELG